MNVSDDIIRVVHFVTRQCPHLSLLTTTWILIQMLICLMQKYYQDFPREKERPSIYLHQIQNPFPGMDALYIEESLANEHRVEKYRPVTLDDVVSHKDITSTSKNINNLHFALPMCSSDEPS